MVYCPRCGTPNQDSDAFCRNCGASLKDHAPGAPGDGAPPGGLKGQDKTLIFLGNLCISPVLGLALYLIWRDKKPLEARQTCALTWWSLGAWAILLLLFVALAVVLGLLEKTGRLPR